MVEPNFEDDAIEKRIPVTTADPFNRAIGPANEFGTEVNVLMTTVVWAIELRISKPGTNEFDFVGHYTPVEARQLGEQIASKTLSQDKFGYTLSEQIGEELKTAADQASTYSLREMAGVEPF